MTRTILIVGATFAALLATTSLDSRPILLMAEAPARHEAFEASLADFRLACRRAEDPALPVAEQLEPEAPPAAVLAGVPVARAHRQQHRT